MNSDTAVVIQIPLPPNKKVRTNKLIVTITKLLPKDMMAEDSLIVLHQSYNWLVAEHLV